MAFHITDVIIDDDDDDDENDDKRQALFDKIDKFVDEKLGKNYVSVNDYLKRKLKNYNNKNTNASMLKDFNDDSFSLIRNEIKHGRKKTKYEKKFLTYKPGKEPTFKSYETIMKRVKNKFNDGYYTDIVTYMKNKNKAKLRHKKTGNLFDDDDSSSESEDEEAKHLDFLESIIYQKKSDNVGPLYWQIVKLLRYIRISNVHGSLLCLCYLYNTKLKSAECLRAMEDSDGISLLLNLLTANDLRCRIGSLNIIKELSNIMYYCRNLTFLGGIQPLVDNLKHQNNDLQGLAAEILAKMAVFKRARSNIRRFDGISHLVYLLSIDLPNMKQMAITKRRSLLRPSVIQRNKLQISVTQSAATALWKVSKSRRNRICMRRAGIIPSLKKLLYSEDQNILIPAIGILQQCASELYYRISIRTENMFPVLLTHMYNTNTFLKTQTALTIFKCAIDSDAREIFRSLNGTKVLINNLDPNSDHDLLYALTGAIWKMCTCPLICKEFIHEGGMAILIQILKKLPKSFDLYLRPQISASIMLNKLEKAEKITTNVTGALYELSKNEKGRRIIGQENCTKNLVDLLKMDDEHMLYNVISAIKEIAKDEKCLSEIRRLNGIQMLFALTSKQQSYVVAAALEALKSIFDNSKDADELIKTLTGSMELTVKQLESLDHKVLTATCSLIAEMGTAHENVAVLTDLGVVRMLARLVKTDNDDLRCALSNAIATCCIYKDNRQIFGRANIITPLVNFLRSSESKVHAAAAKALYKLSQDVNNSREMNGAGVSHLLINMIGSDNPELQLAAAGALGNMRKLGIEAEKQYMIKKMMKKRKSAVKGK